MQPVTEGESTYMQHVTEEGHIIFDGCGGIYPHWIAMSPEKLEKIKELDLVLDEKESTWECKKFEIQPKSGKYQPEDFIPCLVKILTFLEKNDINYGLGGTRYIMKDTLGSFNYCYDYVYLVEWKILNATLCSDIEGIEPTTMKLPIGKEKLN